MIELTEPTASALLNNSETFDVAAYLARIGVQSPDRSDLTTLVELHRAHAAAIPFENLDIQMGRSIDLDPASLQAALVARRRGGYCFQHNALFRHALTGLGFDVRQREARVRRAAEGRILARTHMVLIVLLEGADWLADVGFGGEGLAEPVPLDGAAVVQDGWTYRIRREGPLYVLQRAIDDRWNDLYAFRDDDVYDADYAVANWYTSTHPESQFVRTLTAQRISGDTRHVLRNLTYSVARAGGDWETRTIARAALVPLLRDVYGLDVPDGAQFCALDGVQT
jgi:N-hydroxyarylamine O-acetyltransferase